MVQRKTDYSDSDLIKLFRLPERREFAFTIIIDRYKERLYWHIRKMLLNHEDTDDVLQETFIKIWKGLEKFRGDSGLFTWLYRIATNESLTFLKSRKRKQHFSVESMEKAMGESLKADIYFQGDELQLKLQKAILTLPEKQRLIFNMKYFDDLKYEEIAEILGQTTGSLKASYHHAVKKIEKYIKSD